MQLHEQEAKILGDIAQRYPRTAEAFNQATRAANEKRCEMPLVGILSSQKVSCGAASLPPMRHAAF